MCVHLNLMPGKVIHCNMHRTTNFNRKVVVIRAVVSTVSPFMINLGIVHFFQRISKSEQ